MRQRSTISPKATIILNKIWKNPVYFIAFGAGSGLIPFAPGTCGTIVAIPLYLLLADTPIVVYCGMIALAFIIGIIVSHIVTRDLGIHDFSGIVCDEIVGYLITMIAVPKKISWIVLGFILFRLFDIWKPQPIRYIDQHVHGGLGIMLDDVLAAIMASLTLQCLIWEFN